MRFLRRRGRPIFESIEAPLHVADAAHVRRLLEQGGAEIPGELEGEAGEAEIAGRMAVRLDTWLMGDP